MSESIDQILNKISNKIKENTLSVPDFFEEERDENPLMFLTQDMIVSNSKSTELNLEKQAKIITYDLYEKLELDVNLHDVYEIILDSLKNINR